MISLTSQVANANICQGLFSAPQISSQNFSKHVRYIDFEGTQIPFIDIGRDSHNKSQKTVLLVSGFSHSMRIWLPHIEFLASKGYRVVSFDKSNIGYHLEKNGLIKHSASEGLAFDGRIGEKVVSSLEGVNELIVIGHSRGAAVAAWTVLMTADKVNISALYLDFPYVWYYWRDQTTPLFYGMAIAGMSTMPNTNGHLLRRNMRPLPDYAKHPDIEQSVQEHALNYTLLGTMSRTRSEEVRTDKLVDEILQSTNISVHVRTGQADTKLSPPEVVSLLDKENVNYKVYEQSDRDHYWPTEQPQAFLLEKGL